MIVSRARAKVESTTQASRGSAFWSGSARGDRKHLVGAAIAAVAVLVIASPDAAHAAGKSKRLGTFEAWTAMAFNDDGKPSCMLWSQPQKSSGKYSRRGEVFVFVTHRPDERSFDKLTYEAGYAYRSGSQAKVEIDEQSFTLQTDGSVAWTASTALDGELVQAMRVGRKMVVKGVSSRGTQTVDEFSLYGFTKAYGAISKVCVR